LQRDTSTYGTPTQSTYSICNETIKFKVPKPTGFVAIGKSAITCFESTNQQRTYSNISTPVTYPPYGTRGFNMWFSSIDGVNMNIDKFEYVIS
jgi:hypothetical protein